MPCFWRALWFVFKVFFTVSLIVLAAHLKGSFSIRLATYTVGMSLGVFILALIGLLYVTWKMSSLLESLFYRIKIFFLKKAYSRKKTAFQGLLEGQSYFYRQDITGIKETLKVRKKHLKEGPCLNLLKIERCILEKDFEGAVTAYQAIVQTPLEKIASDILYRYSPDAVKEKILEIQRKNYCLSKWAYITMAAKKDTFIDAERQLHLGRDAGKISCEEHALEQVVLKAKFLRRDTLQDLYVCLKKPIPPCDASRLIEALFLFGKTLKVHDFAIAQKRLKAHKTSLSFLLLAVLALKVDLWGVSKLYAKEAIAVGAKATSAKNTWSYFQAQSILAHIEKSEKGETKKYIEYLQKSSPHYQNISHVVPLYLF